MKISKIKIGKRHRLDLGDIKSLAASIKAVGLLHPVVIRPDGRLIAGERRMAAFKSLGRTEIPATVVDIKSIVLGEAAENFDRKDFTLSEAVAIKREIEPEIKAEAKERMLAGKPCGKLPPGVKGKARDEVAKFTGVKPRTLEKAEAVVKAAEDNPAKFGKLKDEMDRTGRVDGAFKRLKVARQAAAIKAEAPPLPNQGPYRVIVVDPPWPYEVRQEDPSHRAVHPYPLMSIKQICEVKIAEIAHGDCILWLWTTNNHMFECREVLESWGFQNKTILTWAKNRFGTGDWLRGQTEHCMLATRGRPTVTLTNQSTLLHGPLRANSQKPDEFFPFVESLCPATRYAYCFARDNFERPNWDCHGDEVKK